MTRNKGSVLVTGGAGYIGSHIVRTLRREGYVPVILDDLSEGHRESAGGERIVQADIADRGALNELLGAGGVVGCVHMAARCLVGESMEKPRRYFRENLTKSLELLDALLDHGVRAFVLSSTAAVYGEPEKTPITEDLREAPINPYGESKYFFERALDRARAAEGLRFAALRYFNAAGAHPSGEIGEDHAHETHLIPLAIRAAMGLSRKLTIFGEDYPTPDGTCVRDYVHVEDLAQAHVLALDALVAGERGGFYNLGSEHGHSVREVLDTVRSVTGRDLPVEAGPRRPGDPAVLVASSARIQKKLGWRPRYADLRTIVETAWEWHRRHPEGYATGAGASA